MIETPVCPAGVRGKGYLQPRLPLRGGFSGLDPPAKCPVTGGYTATFHQRSGAAFLRADCSNTRGFTTSH